jgi:hypothetical protein
MTTETERLCGEARDIADISDIRRLSRVMLLAALELSEGNDLEEVADLAVDFNAYGWHFILEVNGAAWPTNLQATFTPRELETVVRLARYFIATEAETEL